MNDLLNWDQYVSDSYLLVFCEQQTVNSLPLFQYINQILNNFFTVYNYIQCPRYNNILYSYNCYNILRCNISGAWVIKYFWKIHYNVNLLLHIICEIHVIVKSTYMWEVSLEFSNQFRETVLKRKENRATRLFVLT